MYNFPNAPFSLSVCYKSECMCPWAVWRAFTLCVRLKSSSAHVSNPMFLLTLQISCKSQILTQRCSAAVNQSAGLYTVLICVVWPSNPDWGIFSSTDTNHKTLIHEYCDVHVGCWILCWSTTVWLKQSIYQSMSVVIDGYCKWNSVALQSSMSLVNVSSAVK